MKCLIQDGYWTIITCNWWMGPSYWKAFTEEWTSKNAFYDCYCTYTWKEEGGVLLYLKRRHVYFTDYFILCQKRTECLSTKLGNVSSTILKHGPLDQTMGCYIARLYSVSLYSARFYSAEVSSLGLKGAHQWRLDLNWPKLIKIDCNWLNTKEIYQNRPSVSLKKSKVKIQKKISRCRISRYKDSRYKVWRYNNP